MGASLSKDEEWKLKANQKAAAHWTVPEDVEGGSAGSSQSSNSKPISLAEGDRVYHSVKSSPYILPADIQEGQRLNVQHHLMLQLFEGVNYSGITKERLEQGTKVLDVGYVDHLRSTYFPYYTGRFGSGIWLAEMNRDFPRGYYYGVDISISAFGETFRDLAEDGKITLVTGNVYERLPFEDSTFDYIHQQGLSQAIPERLWPSAISELVRVLKPGGVIDLIEIVPVAVPTGKPDPIVRDLHHAQYKALMSRGLNIYIGHSLLNLVEMYPMLEHATCIRRTAPVGWDGLAGELWSTNAKKAFIAAADFASVAAGKTKEEWAAYIDRVAIGWAQSKSFANVVFLSDFCAHMTSVNRFRNLIVSSNSP